MKIADIFNENRNVMKKYRGEVAQIRGIAEDYRNLNDNQLRDITHNLKTRLESGENERTIRPYAFGAVVESSRRNLNMVHYDEQLVAGILMAEGKIVEVATGEGKTLASTTTTYLKALSGNVYLITANPYLAKRDAHWMGPIYENLGLSVKCVNEYPIWYRPDAYNADIIYGSPDEIIFDYLRDGNISDIRMKTQKKWDFIVIDEIDKVLLDDSQTPFIISENSKKHKIDNTSSQNDTTNEEFYKFIAKIAHELEKDNDFKIDYKEKNIKINDSGYNKIDKNINHEILNKNYEILENLKSDYINMSYFYVSNILHVKYLMENGKDYIISDGKIDIIDKNTGRLEKGRSYSFGIHQAIEVLENVPITDKNNTVDSISIKNFLFNFHNKNKFNIVGMSGTIMSAKDEMNELYGLDVVYIPTHKKTIRIDNNPKVFLKKEHKYNVIIDESIKLNNKGSPVLIITNGVEESKYINKRLESKGINSSLLNAEKHEDEAEIIKYAGAYKSVTVATNIAGRGVDIVLGGPKPDENDETFDSWKNSYNKVKNLGGLHVLITEPNFSERIDNQARGRAGRQGDPGQTELYLSLEDMIVKSLPFDKIIHLLDSNGKKEINGVMKSNLLRGINKIRNTTITNNIEISKFRDQKDYIMNTHRKIFRDHIEDFITNDKDYIDLLPLIRRFWSKYLFYKDDINLDKDYVNNMIGYFNTSLDRINEMEDRFKRYYDIRNKIRENSE